jgi:hypothetical protein
MVFEIQKATICWIATSYKASIHFPVLLCSQNSSPLLFKVCHLLISLLMFLQSTPKIQITCLLLLVLSYVAQARTISLAITMDENFRPFKWFVKPHFKFSITPCFSFNLFRSHKYSGTHRTYQNLFNNYTLEGNWVPIQEFKNEQRYNIGQSSIRLWTYQ